MAGNFKLSGNFEIDKAEHIDDRCHVKLISDLNDIPVTKLYQGLEVFVDEDKNYYQYINNKWQIRPGGGTPSPFDDYMGYSEDGGDIHVILKHDHSTSIWANLGDASYITGTYLSSNDITIYDIQDPDYKAILLTSQSSGTTPDLSLVVKYITVNTPASSDSITDFSLDYISSTNILSSVITTNSSSFMASTTIVSGGTTTFDDYIGVSESPLGGINIRLKHNHTSDVFATMDGTAFHQGGYSVEEDITSIWISSITSDQNVYLTYQSSGSGTVDWSKVVKVLEHPAGFSKPTNIHTDTTIANLIVDGSGTYDVDINLNTAICVSSIHAISGGSSITIDDAMGNISIAPPGIDAETHGIILNSHNPSSTGHSFTYTDTNNAQSQILLQRNAIEFSISDPNGSTNIANITSGGIYINDVKIAAIDNPQNFSLADGNYTVQASMSNNQPTYSWVVGGGSSQPTIVTSTDTNIQVAQTDFNVALTLNRALSSMSSIEGDADNHIFFNNGDIRIETLAENGTMLTYYQDSDVGFSWHAEVPTDDGGMDDYHLRIDKTGFYIQVNDDDPSYLNFFMTTPNISNPIATKADLSSVGNNSSVSISSLDPRTLVSSLQDNSSVQLTIDTTGISGGGSTTFDDYIGVSESPLGGINIRLKHNHITDVFATMDGTVFHQGGYSVEEDITTIWISSITSDQNVYLTYQSSGSGNVDWSKVVKVLEHPAGFSKPTNITGDENITVTGSGTYDVNVALNQTLNDIQRIQNNDGAQRIDINNNDGIAMQVAQESGLVDNVSIDENGIELNVHDMYGGPGKLNVTQEHVEMSYPGDSITHSIEVNADGCYADGVLINGSSVDVDDLAIASSLTAVQTAEGNVNISLAAKDATVTTISIPMGTDTSKLAVASSFTATKLASEHIELSIATSSGETTSVIIPDSEVDIHDLAVTSSLTVSANTQTGVLNVALTAKDGTTTTAATNIGTGGQYTHTFDIESADSVYNIAAATISFTSVSTPYFTDQTSFISYLQNTLSSDTLTGLWGTATPNGGGTITKELSSIVVGDYLDHMVFDNSFAFNSSISSASITNGAGTVLSFKTQTDSSNASYWSVSLTPSYGGNDIIIYNGSDNSWADDTSDSATFKWVNSSKTLSFMGLNININDKTGTFVYDGSALCTVNDNDVAGVPTALKYLGQDADQTVMWQWTILPNDGSDEIQYTFKGNLNPCVDNVSSEPVPSVGNYDTLINKPYNYSHQSLENFINGIKSKADSAKKLATAAQVTAAAADASCAHLELMFYTPIPIPFVWPHEGLYWWVTWADAEFAGLDADVTSLRNDIDDLRQEIEELKDRDYVENIFLEDAAAHDEFPYGLYIKDNATEDNKHDYELSLKNAGTGFNGGPEYALIGANSGQYGLKDESNMIKFDRFDALRETRMTFVYDPNHFDIVADMSTIPNQDRFSLKKAITFNNSDFSITAYRYDLIGARSELGLKGTEAVLSFALSGASRANSARLSDGVFVIKFGDDQSYIFDADDGFNMGNKKITNLATPTDPQDAVTKAYVDNVVANVFDDYIGWQVTQDGTGYQIMIKNDHTTDVWLNAGNTYINGTFDNAQNMTYYVVTKTVVGGNPVFLMNVNAGNVTYDHVLREINLIPTGLISDIYMGYTFEPNGDQKIYLKGDQSNSYYVYNQDTSHYAVGYYQQIYDHTSYDFPYGSSKPLIITTQDSGALNDTLFYKIVTTDKPGFDDFVGLVRMAVNNYKITLNNDHSNNIFVTHDGGSTWTTGVYIPGSNKTVYDIASALSLKNAVFILSKQEEENISDINIVKVIEATETSIFDDYIGCKYVNNAGNISYEVTLRGNHSTDIWATIDDGAMWIVGNYVQGTDITTYDIDADATATTIVLASDGTTPIDMTKIVKTIDVSGYNYLNLQQLPIIVDTAAQTTTLQFYNPAANHFQGNVLQIDMKNGTVNLKSIVGVSSLKYDTNGATLTSNRMAIVGIHTTIRSRDNILDLGDDGGPITITTDQAISFVNPQKISNVADPDDDQDVATKAYVDTKIANSFDDFVGYKYTNNGANNIYILWLKNDHSADIWASADDGVTWVVGIYDNTDQMTSYTVPIGANATTIALSKVQESPIQTSNVEKIIDLASFTYLNDYLNLQHQPITVDPAAYTTTLSYYNPATRAFQGGLIQCNMNANTTRYTGASVDSYILMKGNGMDINSPTHTLALFGNPITLQSDRNLIDLGGGGGAIRITTTQPIYLENAQKISNVADPTDAQDVATKAYVDSLARPTVSQIPVYYSHRIYLTMSINQITSYATIQVMVKNFSDVFTKATLINYLTNAQATEEHAYVIGHGETTLTGTEFFNVAGFWTDGNEIYDTYITRGSILSTNNIWTIQNEIITEVQALSESSDQLD